MRPPKLSSIKVKVRKNKYPEINMKFLRDYLLNAGARSLHVFYSHRPSV